MIGEGEGLPGIKVSFEPPIPVTLITGQGLKDGQLHFLLRAFATIDCEEGAARAIGFTSNGALKTDIHAVLIAPGLEMEKADLSFSAKRHWVVDIDRDKIPDLMGMRTSRPSDFSDQVSVYIGIKNLRGVWRTLYDFESWDCS